MFANIRSSPRSTSSRTISPWCHGTLKAALTGEADRAVSSVKLAVISSGASARALDAAKEAATMLAATRAQTPGGGLRAAARRPEMDRFTRRSWSSSTTFRIPKAMLIAVPVSESFSFNTLPGEMPPGISSFNITPAKQAVSRLLTTTANVRPFHSHALQTQQQLCVLCCCVSSLSQVPCKFELEGTKNMRNKESARRCKV